jgi:hypothetical protein
MMPVWHDIWHGKKPEETFMRGHADRLPAPPGMDLTRAFCLYS